MIRALIPAFVTGALWAGAQPAGMSSFRSRNYQVITDLERRSADEIARHMDRVFEEYHRRFAAFPQRNAASYPLYLFQAQEGYLEYLRGEGVNAANTAGIFYRTSEGDGLAAWVGGQDRSELLATLQHEGFHQFAYARIGRGLPTWANEGLAEYFGAGYFTKNRFVLGRVEESRLEALRQRVDRGQALPLSQLLGMTAAEWSARVARGDESSWTMYAQSWSVVQFLIDGERGKYQDMFLEYLKGTGTGLQHRQAFARAFGTSDEGEFEAAWKRHLAALKPDPVSTAMLRLAFLSQGLRMLHESGVAPGSLDELRAALVKARFKAMRMTAAGFERVSAEDASVYEVPPEKEGGLAGAPELLASKDSALPPSIRTTVGRVVLSTVWKRDASGKLGYEILVE